jgi:N-sulfoglucosamine sulfohydrolase
MRNLPKFLLLIGCFIIFLPACISVKPDKPNILWLTCEDISPHLGCYGDPDAWTPNLDVLAGKGIRFSNAFAPAPVCTPARSSLITGVYASSLGTQHLRGPAAKPEEIRCFTEYLREAGYYCTNNSKEDYNFKTPASAWDNSSDSAHWRGRQKGQSFFSVFNYLGTHQSRTRYLQDKLDEVNRNLAHEEQHDPASLHLPPYYPDTKIVRQNMAALHDRYTCSADHLPA